jgi:hypothetical protein
MMNMFRLRAPDGIGSAQGDGNIYEVVDGIVTVPAYLLHGLIAAGFVLLADSDSATAVPLAPVTDAAAAAAVADVIATNVDAQS